MTCRHGVAAVFLSLATWLAVEPAVAQTVTVTQMDRRPNRTLVAPNNMNREDCLADEAMTASVRIDTNMNLTSYNIAVWAGAGTDCTMDDNRNGTDSPCW